MKPAPMTTQDLFHRSPIPSRGATGVWLAGLVLVLTVLGWRWVGLFNWGIPENSNAAFREAVAWRHGTMDLGPPYYELAPFGGKHYNVVGPLFTALCVVGIQLTQLLGGPADTIAPWLLTIFIALPLPVALFGCYRALGLSNAWAAGLTLHAIVGTSLWYILGNLRTGDLYTFNHVLATVGLSLLLGDLLGKRRIWPAGIGLCIAVWSRQMTCLYAAPLLWIAWRGPSWCRPSPCGSPSREPSDSLRVSQNALRSATSVAPSVSPERTPDFNRRRRILTAVAFIALAASVPMTLSAIKFGNPLDSGYPRMFDNNRNDADARDARRQFLGPVHWPKHFRAMFLSVPTIEIRQGRLMIDAVDTPGTALWVTNPLVLAVVLTARRWWTDRARRALMLASFAVLLGVAGYHNTSAQNSGCYRYALDFLPVWFAVVAPYLSGARAREWALLAMTWSVAYFLVLVR